MALLSSTPTSGESAGGRPFSKRPPSVGGFVASARWLLRVFLCWIALMGGEPNLVAQSSREYAIKAAFLFNFAQFVEWPEHAFATPESPIVIGIIGVNPFGASLDKIVRDELVRGRKIEIRYFPRGRPWEQCHVLFIAQSESSRFREVLRSVRGKPALLVSDIDDFAREGGMIGFITEQHKVRFEINLEAAKEARLSLSSKLLRLGHLVQSDLK